MSCTKSPFVAGVVGRIGTRMVISPPLLLPLPLLLLLLLLLMLLLWFVAAFAALAAAAVAMMVDDDDDELLFALVAVEEVLFIGAILIVALSCELVIYEVYWLATLIDSLLLFLKQRNKVQKG